MAAPVDDKASKLVLTVVNIITQSITIRQPQSVGNQVQTGKHFLFGVLNPEQVEDQNVRFIVDHVLESRFVTRKVAIRKMLLHLGLLNLGL